MATAMGWRPDHYWRSTPAELRMAFDGWQVATGRRQHGGARLDRARADAIRERAMAALSMRKGTP